MNIVIDSNVNLDSQSREYLKKISPEGLSPLILDEFTGKLNNTLNDSENTVFITSIPIDVMKYHGDFFKNSKNVPQWFFIVYGSNSHGISLLKNNAELNYSLNNCSYYYAPDSDGFLSAVSEISEESLRIAGKTMIFTKHSKNNDKTAEKIARYLFCDETDKYEIAYEKFDEKIDASILLLCGEEERDFKKIEIPKGMQPIFVVTNPEKHLQQYLHPEHLINLIAELFNMTTERAQKRIFFVSNASQEWHKKRNTGRNAIQNGLLMWDRFGLPVSRDEYTKEKIEAFLKNGYFDGDKLKSIIL